VESGKQGEVAFKFWAIALSLKAIFIHFVVSVCMKIVTLLFSFQNSIVGANPTTFEFTATTPAL
jgi:hypothetical protein